MQQVDKCSPYLRHLVVVVILALIPFTGSESAVTGTAPNEVSRCLASCSSSSEFQSSEKETLLELAQYLVDAGRLRLAGETVSMLYAEGEKSYAYRESDAQALLDLARNERIYVFIHGFEFQDWGGKPMTTTVEDTWSKHLDLLSNIDDGTFSAVLSRSNSLDGFGDHQPQIGNLLFALRWLTDDPRLYSSERRIFVVGYSAGGNYAKQAYLLFRQNLEASRVAVSGRANTPMSFYSLGTPHKGTDLTTTAATGLALFNMFLEKAYLKNDQYGDRAWAMARYKDMSSSRGFNQLRTGSSALSRLDREFFESVKQAGNIDYISIASVSDEIVAVESASSSKSYGMTFADMRHADFLDPSSYKLYADFLTYLYSNKPDDLLADLRTERLSEFPDAQTLFPERVSTGPANDGRPLFALNEVALTDSRSNRIDGIVHHLMSRTVVDIPNAEQIFLPVAERIDFLIEGSEIADIGKDDYWFGTWNDMPTFKLNLISDFGDSDGVDEITQQRYERLEEEIEDTVDPLLSSVLYMWADRPQSSESPYVPKFPDSFVELLSGPRNVGPGALVSAQMEYPKWAFYDIGQWEKMSSQENYIVKLGENFQGNVFAENMLVRVNFLPLDGNPDRRVQKFYWHEKAPEGWENLGRGHVLKKYIGAPQETIPMNLADIDW